MEISLQAISSLTSSFKNFVRCPRRARNRRRGAHRRKCKRNAFDPGIRRKRGGAPYATAVGNVFVLETPVRWWPDCRYDFDQGAKREGARKENEFRIDGCAGDEGNVERLIGAALKLETERHSCQISFPLSHVRCVRRRSSSPRIRCPSTIQESRIAFLGKDCFLVQIESDRGTQIRLRVPSALISEPGPPSRSKCRKKVHATNRQATIRRGKKCRRAIEYGARQPGAWASTNPRGRRFPKPRRFAGERRKSRRAPGPR